MPNARTDVNPVMVLCGDHLVCSCSTGWRGKKYLPERLCWLLNALLELGTRCGPPEPCSRTKNPCVCYATSVGAILSLASPQWVRLNCHLGPAVDVSY